MPACPRVEGRSRRKLRSCDLLLLTEVLKKAAWCNTVLKSILPILYWDTYYILQLLWQLISSIVFVQNWTHNFINLEMNTLSLMLSGDCHRNISYRGKTKKVLLVRNWRCMENNERHLNAIYTAHYLIPPFRNVVTNIIPHSFLSCVWWLNASVWVYRDLEETVYFGLMLSFFIHLIV